MFLYCSYIVLYCSYVFYIVIICFYIISIFFYIILNLSILFLYIFYFPITDFLFIGFLVSRPFISISRSPVWMKNVNCHPGWVSAVWLISPRGFPSGISLVLTWEIALLIKRSHTSPPFISHSLQDTSRINKRMSVRIYRFLFFGSKFRGLHYTYFSKAMSIYSYYTELTITI